MKCIHIPDIHLGIATFNSLDRLVENTGVTVTVDFVGRMPDCTLVLTD